MSLTRWIAPTRTHSSVNGHEGPAAIARAEPALTQLSPATDLGAATGVTEIRVHGVGGTTPETMLADANPERVAGDRVAGFYREPDPSADRHVEAYSWGGLTSRSRTRALWIFLLPFMLANLAGWTSPPRKGPTVTRQGAKGPVHEFRLAAAKWGALGLTLSVMMTFALLVMDVVAYQCGAQPTCAAGATWLTPLTWGDLPHNPAHRLLLGAAVLVAILGVFSVLSYTSRERYEAIEPPCTATKSGPTAHGRSTASASHLPGGLLAREFWSGQLAHARLTRAHLAGGLAVVATTLVVCTWQLDTSGDDGQTILWLTATALAVASIAVAVGILASDDTPRLGRVQWPSVVCLLLATGGVGVAGAAAWRSPPPTAPGAGQAPGVTLAFNVVWIVIGLLLLPLALTTFSRRPKRPARDRDGIGWIPPFSSLGLGILVAQAVLLSVLIFVARRLSPDGEVKYENLVRLDVLGGPQPIVLPPMTGLATAYFIWATLGLVLIFATTFAVNYWRSGRGAAMAVFLAGTSGADYATETEHYTEDFRRRGGARAWEYSATVSDPAVGIGLGPSAWTSQRARWEFLAGSSRYVSRLVNSMVAVAVAATLAVWVFEWLVHLDPPGLAVDAAVTVAVLLPPALAAFIALSWRKLAQRRVLGTLWDVGTFWPRSFHPFAPPCYAERAVPELTRRVWWLNDQGGEVVISAHSQGSIVAAAVALRHDLEVDNRPRFGLVTFGSPLRKLYGRAFPAYWTSRTIASVGDHNTGLVVDNLWRNVYYLTDYIGGAVHVATADRRLPDPATSVYVYGQPKPRVASHTGYASDPRFRSVVEWMCEAVKVLSPRG